MQEMRGCYDSLLSAAAATTNSAYEFSEALEEMGSCLLEKTALNDDEDSSRALMMLGKAQFALQKLVDSYRANIVHTITNPSESLLRELQNVEDMKRQCDGKRDYYKLVLAAYREKGKLRHAKSETYSAEQLEAALVDYEEEAALFVFRLKSLKQGQCRSLLTQAARHHAAQLSFFRKGLKYLEAIEPHVKEVAEKQHIDYQFSGLEDDDSENDDGDYYGNDHSDDDDGELSFDYGINNRDRDDAFASRNSMELDQVNQTVSPEPSKEHRQENAEKAQSDFIIFRTNPAALSQSAPLYPDTKFDPSEKIKQVQPSSTRKFHSYVLPTPVDDKNSPSRGPTNAYYSARLESKGGGGAPTNLWHSSPLTKDFMGSNINSGPISTPLVYPYATSDVKKMKREAFSGPITSKAWSTNQGPSPPKPRPNYAPQRTSPPPPISSPKISELHELPRPPVSGPTSSLVGYSGPLVSKRQVLISTSRASPAAQAASPLPAPPASMTRSFSIPSSAQRDPVVRVGTMLGPNKSGGKEEVASPTLSPISLSSVPRRSTTSESTTGDARPRGTL
ncbi:uncharacterized protein At2g33490-like [Ananas comosus]|uniref:Uncharacterized protein At2g33490-like n=1 Tax=Ananas comosus TaxID=4615 RepID=A0A6P5H2H5_ANACO|nr:uncharacterized protein At2g33490-like [Ananas comosus]